jgi:RNA polymerase sigma factor (sigma-70 family)
MSSTPPDRWSDRSTTLAEALSRVALGDRAAFATVYQASSAHLFGVILRINPDRGQAADILQEIYISIWHAAKGFDPLRSQPMTWLTSIARNRAIDSLRRRKTEVSTVSRHVAADDDDDDVDRLADMASDTDGPLALLQRAAEARAVGHCVQQLSAEQQQCVALAYYQGLSHAEVADHLSQPLGTVKSWVRRALIALKDCLGRIEATGIATGARGA